MASRTFSRFVFFLVVFGVSSPTAFADATNDVSLTTANGKVSFSVDHFVTNTSTFHTVVVSVKVNWIESLRPNERVYVVEVKAGEKKLVVTQQPLQTNFTAVITSARYK